MVGKRNRLIKNTQKSDNAEKRRIKDKLALVAWEFNKGFIGADEYFRRSAQLNYELKGEENG